MKPAPESMASFVAAIPESTGPMFERLHACARTAGPALQEVFRWGSPCFKGRKLVCGIGVFKDDVSLTPGTAHP